jgi:hypothetical protein
MVTLDVLDEGFADEAGHRIEDFLRRVPSE